LRLNQTFISYCLSILITLWEQAKRARKKSGVQLKWNIYSYKLPLTPLDRYFYYIFNIFAFYSVWISSFNFTYVRTGVCQDTPLECNICNSQRCQRDTHNTIFNIVLFIKTWKQFFSRYIDIWKNYHAIISLI